MARPKCDFLSGGGIVFNIVKALVDATIEQGGTPDNVHAILTKEGATKLKAVATILAEKPAKPEPPKPAFPEPTIKKIDVTVDPTKSFEELKADGKYPQYSVSTNITEQHFPMGPIPAGRELVRVCFHRGFRNKDEVVAARAALNLEAVTSPAYLLTVGAQTPDLQKEGPIVDIDSNRSFPIGQVGCSCLWFYAGKRRLDLHWIDSGFSESYWFLALRNIPKP